MTVLAVCVCSDSVLAGWLGDSERIVLGCVVVAHRRVIVKGASLI